MSQRRAWQLVWLCLSSCIAAAYFWLATQQLLEPWGVRHHAFFSPVLPAAVVAAGEVLSGLCAVGVGVTWLPIENCFLQKLVLAASSALGACWALALRSAAHTQGEPLSACWRHLWLPLGPPLFAGLASLALQTVAGTEAELRRLRKHLYNFKKA